MVKTMKIRARAPLRIGIAGGGTDVSPYCDVYGGCVLNATIDRYAYTTIEASEGDILFQALDRSLFETWTPDKFSFKSSSLKLHAAVYSYMMEKYHGGINLPLKLSTFCDAPIGSGLGSSSTIVVSMISAFCELLNIPMDDYKIAQTAFHIERDICLFNGGAQDQYAASFGGVNFMEFYSDRRVIVNPLRVKERILSEMESSLLLFFTGVSRDSSKIIDAQSKSVQGKDQRSIEAMHSIKDEAKRMKDSLLTGNFPAMVESLRRGWESKKRSASVVSNEKINRAFRIAIAAGALAGKVSGAGGGGFILFFVPLEKRKSVIDALSKEDGFISRCHFTDSGARAWRVYEE